VHPGTQLALERAGGAPDTTNNRMELLAVIEALRAVKRAQSQVLVCSDSRYVIDACSKWIAGWKRRGWTRKDGPLKNVDLLREVDELIPRYTVRWQWVAGHSGDPGNDRADALANIAMDRIAAGEAAVYERRLRWTARLPA
jgi:ribonuclease HI